MVNLADYAKALRSIADAIEATEIPYPEYLTLHVFAHNESGESISQETARAVMAAWPGGWDKRMTSEFVDYAKYLDGDRGIISYTIHVDRGAVCERVQTGTRHIPAQEARDEPVYEWVCP
jgi:hypothetical protein